MGREDRYWERPALHPEDDDDVGTGAGIAVGLAFILIVFGSGVVTNFWAPGIAIGVVVGLVAVYALNKAMVANRRPARREPRDLL
jgi:hypothetical protein